MRQIGCPQNAWERTSALYDNIICQERAREGIFSYCIAISESTILLSKKPCNNDVPYAQNLESLEKT